MKAVVGGFALNTIASDHTYDRIFFEHCNRRNWAATCFQVKHARIIAYAALTFSRNTSVCFVQRNQHHRLAAQSGRELLLDCNHRR